MTPLLFAETVDTSLAFREMLVLRSSFVGNSEKFSNLLVGFFSCTPIQSPSAHLEAESLLAISYLPISFSFHSFSLRFNFFILKNFVRRGVLQQKNASFQGPLQLKYKYILEKKINK